MPRHADTGRRPQVVAAILLAIANGCSDNPEPSRDDRPAIDGALHGELAVYIATHDDGRIDKQFALVLPSGRERWLSFTTPTELPPGSAIKVWGVDTGADLRVSRIERAPEDQSGIETHRAALIGGPKKAERRWAFVLVDIGGGMNLTKERAQQLLFADAPGSIRSYYREVSYGVRELNGEIFGPFTYQPQGTCDTSALANTLRPMIPGTFHQYLWYFGSRVPGCGFAGLASLGTSDRPSRDTWYNGSSGCVVLVQEPGHNFGLLHSSSLRCTKDGAPVTIVNNGETGCVHSEYGNPFDPMGSGCYHMNGYQKAYEDWLGDCNVVKATTSGTYTVFPLEKACTGLQMLQIPLAAPRMIMATDSGMRPFPVTVSNYFVELRAPIGIDQRLTPRLLVHVAGEVRDAMQRSSRNWILDMTPETPSMSDAALPVGRTFKDPDPNGPSITLVAADATSATIRVELPGGGDANKLGTGTCMNGAMFTAPGPNTCEAPPMTPAGDAGGQPDAGARDAVAAATDGAVDMGRAPVGGSAGGNGGAGGIPAPAGGSSGGGGGAGGSGFGGNGGAGKGGSAGAGTLANSPTDARADTSAPDPKATATDSGCGCDLGSRAPRPIGILVMVVGGLAMVLGRGRRRRCR